MNTSYQAKVYKVASNVSWSEFQLDYQNAAAASAKSDGSDVTIIGDSVTVRSESEIKRLLPNADIHAQVSKHFRCRDPRCGGGDDGLTILTDLVNEDKLRDVLVFALGSNDESAAGVPQSWIDEVLELAGDSRKVIFVTNFSLDESIDAGYQATNNTYKANALSKPNVSVADWHTAASGHSEYMGDHVHPNDKGTVVFAETIYNAVNNVTGGGRGSDSNCPASISSANIGEAANVPLDGRMAWLFPEGTPTSESAMQKYLATIEVPIIDESGQETTIRLTVHTKLADEVVAIFEDMKRANFKIKPTGTGAYYWRTMRTSNSMSAHAYGVAIDINSDDNPAAYTSGWYAPGENPYSVTDEIVQIWKDHGFYWGGDWSPSYFDPMHFTYTNH